MFTTSERAIYGFINPLFAIAKNDNLSHKEIYKSISYAVMVLKSMPVDRLTAISANINQLFEEHSPEDHKCLLNFFKNFSIKKTDGSYEGFIKPLHEYFSLLNTPPQQPVFALALQNTPKPSFSPQAFMTNAFDLITENTDLEKTFKTIFDTLSKWKKAAEKNYDTTKKMNLIDKTDTLVASLKKLKKEELEYLQIIFSQSYSDHNWMSVVPWVAQNSFYESEGAYQSLNEFMKILFDPYFFPFPNGFGPASQIQRDIIKNKTIPGYNFNDVFKIEDIRRCIAHEPETLKKITTLNKKSYQHFKEDILHRINIGLVSNQNVGLQNIGKLRAFFGEEGCKKITRLDLKLLPKQENHALIELKKYFPTIQHLSITDGELNDKSDAEFKDLKLMSLQIHKTNSRTNFSFLQHLVELKKLSVDREINMDHLLPLKKLEDLDLYIYDKDKSHALKTLTALKKLTLQCGDIEDHSYLENFNLLTHLNLQVQKFSQLKLNNHPDLTTVLVEHGMGEELNIQGLPSLSCLSLKNCKVNKLHLENLPELRELNLANNYIDTNLLHNCKITKLKFLHRDLLSDCTWLMEFPLEELDISYSHVSDLKLISQHPTLKTINISSCSELTDLSDLLNSKSLKTIMLGEWEIGQHVIDQFTSKGINVIKI